MQRTGEPEAWQGLLWYCFWGFLDCPLLIVTTFVVAFGLSLFKIAISLPLTCCFSLAGMLAFGVSMRRLEAPKYLWGFVGMLWPLSLTAQVLMGLSVGVVLAFFHQQNRLHVHHEWDTAPLRYAVWLVSLFACLIGEACCAGILCNSSPLSMKQHSA